MENKSGKTDQAEHAKSRQCPNRIEHGGLIALPVEQFGERGVGGSKGYDAEIKKYWNHNECLFCV